LLVQVQLLVQVLVQVLVQLLVVLLLVQVQLLVVLLLELELEQRQRWKPIPMPRLIIIYSFTSPIYVKFHYMVKLHLQQTTYFNCLKKFICQKVRG
jgi:hypothetical protein